MQVSVETTSTLGRRLTVGVPAEQVNAVVEKRLRDAQKNVRLDGFRPGKVPMREVRRRFGAAVREEVMGEVMRDSFFKAVEQEKLEPAGLPKFEPKAIEDGKDFEFVATFEVYPELELAPFGEIAVERPKAEITEADIDTMIDTLRRQRATWEKVERAAADGDRVNIDYEGFRDGEAFQGGTASGQNLVLGSGSMIPGFEDGLKGLKAGDEKTLSLTFPEDYHAEELKGAAVEFRVRVNAVEEQKLPEVDADFMESFGVGDGDQEKFRAEVRRNMERELKNALRNRVKEQVMEGLVSRHQFDIPAALVNGEIQRMRQQMFQQFGGAGRQFDSSMLPDELFREQAERSVRLGLVVREILDRHELKADPDRVRARIEEIAEQYEDAQEVINYFYGNPQQLQQVEGAVLEDMVVDLVLASANVQEREMPYEEAVRSRQG